MNSTPHHILLQLQSFPVCLPALSLHWVSIVTDPRQYPLCYWWGFIDYVDIIWIISLHLTRSIIPYFSTVFKPALASLGRPSLDSTPILLGGVNSSVLVVPVLRSLSASLVFHKGAFWVPYFFTLHIVHSRHCQLFWPLTAAVCWRYSAVSKDNYDVPVQALSQCPPYMVPLQWSNNQPR